MDKSLFDASWEETVEELDLQEKELKKNEMKREFERQYDEATDFIIKLERSQKNMTKDKMKFFVLSSYRENKFKISQYKEAQEDIKKVYVEMFREDLKR
jgi:hypothetical protein